MSRWYYVAADGQRHGPVPVQELRTLAQAGTLQPGTLLWCEGQPQWRPLHELAGELELPALPPPLPMPGAAPAHARPRRGIPGWLLALLLVGFGLVLLAVLGILAAIALPAYRDYTLRSHSVMAIAHAQAQQPAVEAFLAEHGRCPDNDDPGFTPAADYAGQGVARIEFGEFEDDELCGLEAILAVPGEPALDDHSIWLEYDAEAETWTCSSDVADRLLPASCRG